LKDSDGVQNLWFHFFIQCKIKLYRQLQRSTSCAVKNPYKFLTVWW
jgi:hypothetical protein